MVNKNNIHMGNSSKTIKCSVMVFNTALCRIAKTS